MLNAFLISNKLRTLFCTIIMLSCCFARGLCVNANDAITPNADLSIEAEQTQEGVSYCIYINNPYAVSTLAFKLQFDLTSGEQGTFCAAENECFDLSYSQWDKKSGSVSVTAYLGRSGQKTGFSSPEKLKIAEILIPAPSLTQSALTASFEYAECAGITDINSAAKKGTVTITTPTLAYCIKDFYISHFDNTSIRIIATTEKNAELIFAAYDNNQLADVVFTPVSLTKGENTVSIPQINAANNCRIQAMLWDSVITMTPLTESAYITKQ